MKRLGNLASVCAMAGALIWGTPAHAGLLGHDFTADYLLPTASNVFAPLGTAVANAGPLGEFNYLGGVWIDLTDDQVTFTFLISPTFFNAPFNGFRIRDVDGSANITGLSLASVTNLPGFDAGNFGLSGDDIVVNFVDAGTGLVPTGLPTIVLNVTSGILAIPEPGALALFAAGIAGLGLARHRRAARQC